MALRFVTAKTGSAHISSADWKSLNRGIVGKQKYLLVDTANNDQGGFTALPSQGEISIPPCSLMWSGAHIRNTTTTVLKYTPPTVESTVNVWFHYLKDADTGNETLDFVVTINDQPSPIIDEIEDTTLEAYTLFLYFTHRPGATELEHLNRDFTPIMTLVGTQNRVDRYWSELDQKINQEIENRQSAIDTHGTRLDNLDEDMAVVYSRVMEKTKKLYESDAGGLSSVLTINEPVTNYSLLCFGIREKGLINNIKNHVYKCVPVPTNGYNKYVNVAYQRVEKGTLSTEVTNYSGKITVDATKKTSFALSAGGDLSGEVFEIYGIK